VDYVRKCEFSNEGSRWFVLSYSWCDLSLNPKRDIAMKTIIFPFLLAVSASPAFADFCDYRPSQLIGDSGAGAVGTAGAATAVAGTAAKAAGFYTLTHAATGATMLASTAGGVSAASTVGIMGGTAAGIGTVGAILMAPVTIIAGAVTAVGVAAYEGGCYFTDERVTEYADVLKIMENMDANADSDVFRLLLVNGSEQIQIGPIGNSDNYWVEDLYIVNGTLMNRDWFKNTTVGKIGFFVPTQTE
jgi:hypothetical protein